LQHIPASLLSIKPNKIIFSTAKYTKFFHIFNPANPKNRMKIVVQDKRKDKKCVPLQLVGRTI